MPDQSEWKNKLTVQFVLATMPQLQEKEFDENIKHILFNKFRTDSEKYFTDPKEAETYWYYKGDKQKAVVYNPLKYYMLGNYDIAYVSLIDNFKSAHRLFEPQYREDKRSQADVFSPHTFQSFCGLANQDEEYLKEFFHKNLAPANNQKYFLGICNLKLNNGILIGNGLDFLQASQKIISEKIAQINAKYSAQLRAEGKSEVDVEERKIEYILVQSFSWFEISLLIFTNHPNDISDIVRTLRQCVIDNLSNKEALTAASLYQAVRPATLSESDYASKILQSSIFADTNTYVGLHEKLVECKEDDPFLLKFKATGIKLETEIEWQIKPGHMHMLGKIIDDHKELRSAFDFSNKLYMVTGKSDYLIKENSPDVNNNLLLFRAIYNSASQIFKHVRKMRTKVLFSVSSNPINDREILDLSSALKGLAIKNKQVRLLDRHLKALKISRQIRLKVAKIFSNFSNGVQDVILFPFFLDFKIFVDNLAVLIEDEYKKWDKNKNGEAVLTLDDISVNQFEETLNEWITIFQEGYNLRLLNGWQFEDIIDFDLDFNSSIQQLLSAYNTFAYEIGKMFYDGGKTEYGPIVQFNFKDTKSSTLSINYAVHHLTSPEFVYATLTKEILNQSNYEVNEFRKFMISYDDEQKGIRTLMNSQHFNEMVDADLIDPNYFFNDAVRFIITYNLNFDLFYYWFWTYNFQNTSLYDKSGLFNEEHLRKELFRILFLRKLFENPSQSKHQSPLECPLPELTTYWDRHYTPIYHLVEEYHTQLKKMRLVPVLLKAILKTVQHTFEASAVDVSNSTKISGQNLQDVVTIARTSSVAFESDVETIQKLVLHYKGRIFSYQQLDISINAPKISGLLKTQWYMHKYLMQIFNENDGKICLLRRNWQTGTPLISFIMHGRTQPYMVDQTGGLFFSNMKHLNDYYRKSATHINQILHHSLVQKKSFVQNKLSTTSKSKR